MLNKINSINIVQTVLSAKYEFASSNTTRTTFAFDACFVWKLAPLVDERKSYFHRISIATIDAIEHVLNVANSYLVCCRPSTSLRRSTLERVNRRGG
jgi:hypothetical protein